MMVSTASATSDQWVVVETKLKAPSKITRTTLDRMEDVNIPGIYIIAYMGKVVYVGKSRDSISGRLVTHWYNSNRNNELLGKWMARIFHDHYNVRLDVLEIPCKVIDEKTWLREVEAELIRYFSPLLNVQLIT